MRDVLAPLEAMPSDLPSRTWRCWWLDRPKWLRIGCYAALGMVLLHVGLAVRIVIGLIEPAEIVELRQRDVALQYWWEFMDLEASPFLPEWVVAGFFGKSWSNVDSIEADDRMTDDDLRRITQRAVNLHMLILNGSDVGTESLAGLAGCRQLEILQLPCTCTDDATVESLAKLPRLSSLSLSETLVTRDAVRMLRGAKSLHRLEVSYTDAAPGASHEWLAFHRGELPVRMELFEPGQIPIIGSIRWKDGRRDACFSIADYCERIVDRRPLHTDNEDLWRPNSRYGRFGGLTRQALTFVPDSDGEYHFTLKLGGVLSAPVIISVEDGRPSRDQIEFRMPCTKAEALSQ